MKFWCQWQEQGNIGMVGCLAYIGKQRIRLCPYTSKLNMIFNRLFGWYVCPYKKLKETSNESK